MSTQPAQNNDVSLMLATATSHHRAGRLGEAETIYKEILQKFPDNPDALQFYGLLEHHRNNSINAVELLKKAIAINPFSADYYVNLGAIYKHLGRLRDAIECYQVAIQLQPESAEAYNNLGNVYKEQGKIDMARVAFEKAVALKPGFFNALNNLGLIHQQNNEFDDAEKLYSEAIEAEPGYAEAHNNLGNIQMAKGQLDEAIKSYNTALERNPNYMQAQFNLGNLYASQGKFEEAENYYRKVLKSNPNFYDALFHLAKIVYRHKKYEEVLELLEKAQQIKPHNPVIYHQIGLVLYDLSRYEQAVESFNKALRFKNDFADAYYNKGNAFYGMRRYQDAIEAYQKAIEFRPKFCEAYNNMGNVYTEMGRIDEGEAALKKALEIKPEYDAAYNNLGNIKKQQGKREEAVECYNKALEITADYPEAHRHLALSNKYSPDNLEHAERIKSALKKEGLTDSSRMHLHFALGKIYDDCQMIDEAFEHYKIANDIRHNEMKFDINKHHDYIDRLINIYDNGFFDGRKKFGSDSSLPVLVVGMPRSGTTLVEQIISSHPKAAAGGELVAVHQMEALIAKQLRTSTPYPENARLLDENNTLNFANEYVRYLKSFSEEAERITDKMPDNFLSLGFFRLLFPRGHIIHCRRYPLDSCLSIYFQFFVQANGYAYDLKTLGKYYNEYLRIMEHWRNLDSINMYEVQYEELVANQEKISKEIIKHIGLKWDKACIDFHKNKRPVRTASSDQVRRPMYSSSVNRSKKYESYLKPLIDIINLDN